MELKLEHHSKNKYGTELIPVYKVKYLDKY